jgi:hypothetical protein
MPRRGTAHISAGYQIARQASPPAVPKRGRTRGSLTPVEAGRSRQRQSKRAGLLAFSAALGTALVTSAVSSWGAEALIRYTA